MPGTEPSNSLKISQLSTVAAPVPLTAKLPVVIGGATRVVNLASFLNAVTGGTITSVSAGAGIRLEPNPITSTGTISFYLPGLVLPFAGASAPFGWVFCNGTSYPIGGVYEELFQAISYTYGGSGNVFSVPDLRGRLPFGTAENPTATSPLSVLSFTSGDYHSLGSTGGSENHQLTSGQSPLKTHLHTASGTMIVYGRCNDTNCWDREEDCDPPECYSDGNVHGEVTRGNRQSSSSSTTTTPLAEVDAALAHNNMPPGLVLNYIIKL